MRTLAILGLILALGCGSAFAQAENPAFSRGNEAYVEAEKCSDESEAKELYLKAAESYEEAIRTGGDSWEAHYNLGNARFRIGDFGLAALQYKRAIAIDPQRPEAALNLSLARQAAGLSPQRQAHWLENWGTRLPMKMWMWTGMFAGWTFLALLVLPFLHGGHRLVTVAGALATLALLAACAGGMLGWHLNAQWLTVIGADAALRSAPDAEASSVRSLKAAEELSPLRSHAEWTFVRDEEGGEGWVHAQDVGKVWNR
ncbi:MAG: tetratricopeptide repeat protein [Opitutales bacterium]|nr:tetratricopeptide repeat protein [Opitutales bacterium]